jgi:molybdopterin/thiamine biosynthesis adenylyltransferase
LDSALYDSLEVQEANLLKNRISGRLDQGQPRAIAATRFNRYLQHKYFNPVESGNPMSQLGQKPEKSNQSRRFPL